MPDFVQWKENQFKKMRQEFDTLFDKFFEDFCPPSISFTPPPTFEIVDENDHLIIQAELPGLKKEELEVKLSEDFLLIREHRHKTIEWETGETSGKSFFSTEIRLPCKIDPDQVRAFFKDPVLKITMKKRAASTMKQLDVTMDE